MVNFKKRLRGKSITKTADPVELYETLDRASDKGELRRAQKAVLKQWFEAHSNQKDLILKLHTGQGKTLIGLLMLQSKLNSTNEPVLYLCPNNNLVNQTSLQAKQFGINFCTPSHDLPDEFSEGKSILITSVQKLFNGLTKFGLGAAGQRVGAIVIDDAHASVEAIRAAFMIKIRKGENAYSEIKSLFDSELRNQGVGTAAGIDAGKRDAYMLVPYWEWREHTQDVAKIITKYDSQKSIKFVWPLIRDSLDNCCCCISGEYIEIVPYLAPLDQFTTYSTATHRVFMSATVADDSFLIKGLRIDATTIENPLVYKDEKWSGEKMILIPSLIDEDLNREEMVAILAPKDATRKRGQVAICPSFKNTKDWEKYGALIANTENIDELIGFLHEGKYESTIVVVNRYDGIDLPDEKCRILVLDSKPFSEVLIDEYSDSRRTSSELTLRRLSRTIEQGLGRSVRGEKDYSVIILIGTDLVKAVRSRISKAYFSKQTQIQVEIGLEIAALAREEISGETPPKRVLLGLIKQCLERDDDWKQFYIEKMNDCPAGETVGDALKILTDELSAESAFEEGRVDDAVKITQGIIDKYAKDNVDRGWYLQEMARYLYSKNRPQSIRMQQIAHQKNRLLLKPISGMDVEVLVCKRRIQEIINWIKGNETYESMAIVLNSIFSNLQFGVEADLFERSLKDLGLALGFGSERPDYEWKEGPDNLWALKDNTYIVWECKNQVLLDRVDINEQEAEQMNRSVAWFKKYYKQAICKNLMIISTNKLSRSASFLEPVEIVRVRDLGNLIKRVKEFFKAFEGADFASLAEDSIQDLILAHKIDVDNFLADFAVPVKAHSTKQG